MIKRVLVPLDPSAYTDAALEHACRIARDHGAQVTGLTVLVTPTIAAYVGPAPAGGVHYAAEVAQSLQEDARERLDALLTTFRQRCSAAGVGHWGSVRQGSAPDQIMYEAMFHDLVVIGLRTHFHFATSDDPDDTLRQILDRSVAPIYAVPSDYPRSERMSVLIPFNGSFLAARAMHHLVRLVSPSECSVVRLLTCHDDRERAQALLDSGAGYLAAHGFQDVERMWSADDVREVVEERYLDDADLVVVGAHSQRKLVELVVGSLTKHLLAKATRPLLIG